MTDDLCQGMYDRAITVLETLGEVVPELRLDTTDALPGESRGLRVTARDTETCAAQFSVRRPNQPYGAIRWQAEGAEAYVAGRNLPTALRVEVLDLVLRGWNDTTPLDLTIGLRRNAGEAALSIEAVYLLTKGGEGLQLTGEITGAHFDTLQSAQLSLGSLRLNELTLRFDHNQRVMRALPISRFDIRHDAVHYMRGFRDGLTTGQMNDISFENLRQFIGIFPGSSGVLNVRMSSNDGLGMFQILAAQSAFESQDKTFSDVVSIGMHGVDVSVDWMPGPP